MSRFSRRVCVIEDYFNDVYGKGPTSQTFVIIAVSLLAMLYFVGSLWMVPASLFHAFRSARA